MSTVQDTAASSPVTNNESFGTSMPFPPPRRSMYDETRGGLQGERTRRTPGWPPTCAAVRCPTLLAGGAENVHVAVVHFQAQRVQGHAVHPAALEAPAVDVRIPRTVPAAVLARVLVCDDRVLHR